MCEWEPARGRLCEACERFQFLGNRWRAAEVEDSLAWLQCMETDFFNEIAIPTYTIDECEEDTGVHRHRHRRQHHPIV